jgi:hypothetical protein
MVDYSLFEPRVWREVCVDRTLAEFLSTALFQIVRRVHNDSSIDDGAYPSFEVDWRRSFATRLRDTLLTPSTAVCPGIHRVIPIGVSSSDAMQAMEGAIPKDLQDPYAITVQSSAVDDQCGSIAITQPLQYTVINVNCVIDPGILVDVCRELRTGHRAVVNEVHSMTKKHEEMNRKLSEIQDETKTQLSAMRNEMSALVVRLSKNDTDIGLVDDQQRDTVCSKSKCHNIVTARFLSGKRQKQCALCQSHMVNMNRKRKSAGTRR